MRLKKFENLCHRELTCKQVLLPAPFFIALSCHAVWCNDITFCCLDSWQCLCSGRKYVKKRVASVFISKRLFAFSSLALAWNERFEWGVSPTPLRLLAFYNNDYSHCINNVLCCLPQRNNNRNQSERSPSAANWRSQDQGPLPPAAARQGDSSAQMSSARMRKWPQPDLPCWFSAHEMDCRDSPGCNCSEDTCETWGWGGGCIDLVAGTLRVAPKPWQ